MQTSLPRLAVDIAALLNGVIWAIGGIILVLIWTANSQLMSLQGFILLYLPIGLFWIAGLAWFLDSIDARLPTKGLIVLAAAWVIGVLCSLAGYRDFNDSAQIVLFLLHLVIIGWLPIIVLVLMLRFYFRIHIAMMILIPIAWGVGGIVAPLLLNESFRVEDQLVSIVYIGFGYGIIGFIGGGATLIAVKQAKLCQSTASPSPQT